MNAASELLAQIEHAGIRTMSYTHRQVGGYADSDSRVYPRSGTFYAGGEYQSPAYSGNRRVEVRFRPDDRRLPDLTVAVISGEDIVNLSDELASRLAEVSA